MTILVTLPWPDRLLSPNARVNYHVKAAATATARMIARVATLEQAPKARLPKGAPLAASWLFCPPTSRKYDTDGLGSRCKAYMDGVADALDFNDYQVSDTRYVRGEPYPEGRVELRLDVVAR